MAHGLQGSRRGRRAVALRPETMSRGHPGARPRSGKTAKQLRLAVHRWMWSRSEERRKPRLRRSIAAVTRASCGWVTRSWGSRSRRATRFRRRSRRLSGSERRSGPRGALTAGSGGRCSMSVVRSSGGLSATRTPCRRSKQTTGIRRLGPSCGLRLRRFPNRNGQPSFCTTTPGLRKARLPKCSACVQAPSLRLSTMHAPSCASLSELR